MDKNKKKIRIIGSVIVVLLVLGGIFFLNFRVAPKTIAELRYENTIPDQITVYGFMEKLRSEGKINFKDKTYSGMGKFITELNGIKNGGDGYWIYYVNGQKAQVGISNYKLNPGDVVSWKYSTEKQSTP